MRFSPDPSLHINNYLHETVELLVHCLYGFHFLQRRASSHSYNPTSSNPHLDPSSCPCVNISTQQGASRSSGKLW